MNKPICLRQLRLIKRMWRHDIFCCCKPLKVHSRHEHGHCIVYKPYEVKKTLRAVCALCNIILKIPSHNYIGIFNTSIVLIELEHFLCKLLTKLQWKNVCINCLGWLKIFIYVFLNLNRLVPTPPNRLFF